MSHGHRSLDFLPVFKSHVDHIGVRACIRLRYCGAFCCGYAMPLGNQRIVSILIDPICVMPIRTGMRSCYWVALTVKDALLISTVPDKIHTIALTPASFQKRDTRATHITFVRVWPNRIVLSDVRAITLAGIVPATGSTYFRYVDCTFFEPSRRSR